MSVRIVPWLSEPSFYQVFLGDVQVGCITQNSNREFYFHEYATYDRSDAYGQQLVVQAAHDHCVVLNIARRLMS